MREMVIDPLVRIPDSEINVMVWDAIKKQSVPSVTLIDKFGMNYGRGGNYTTVPWARLECIAATLGFDIKDMIMYDGRQCIELNNNDYEFIQCCNKLSAENRVKLLRFMEDTGCIWWERTCVTRKMKAEYLNSIPENGYMTSPYGRVLLLCEYYKNSCKPANDEIKECQKVLKPFKFNSRKLSIPDMLKVAHAYGVSPHWLLCLSNKTALLTDDGVVDELLDIYRLINDDERSLAEVFARKLCDTQTRRRELQ